MIKIKVMGGFCGDVIVPHRVGKAIPWHDQILKLREATTREFEVLCHNHFSPHNDIVEETILKVNAIIDGETCRLLFESAFYLRPGREAHDFRLLYSILQSDFISLSLRCSTWNK